MKLFRRCICIYLSSFFVLYPLAAQQTVNAKLYLKTGIIVEGTIEEVTPETVRFNQTLDDGSHLIQNVPVTIIYKLISPSGEEIILNQDLRQVFERNLTRQGFAKQTDGSDYPSVDAASEDNSIIFNNVQNVKYESRKLIVRLANNNANQNSHYWNSFEGSNEITETYFFSISGNKKDSDSAFRHNHSPSMPYMVGPILTSAGFIIYLFGVGKFIRDSFANQADEEEESTLLPTIGALMTISGAAIWLNSKFTEKPRWAMYSYALETANNYNTDLEAEILEAQTQ